MFWPPHEVNYIVCLIHSKALVGEVPDTDHRGKETGLRACASESAFDPSSGSPGADVALATGPTQRVAILQGFEATGEGRALGRGSGAAVGEKLFASGPLQRFQLHVGVLVNDRYASAAVFHAR